MRFFHDWAGVVRSNLSEIISKFNHLKTTFIHFSLPPFMRQFFCVLSLIPALSLDNCGVVRLLNSRLVAVRLDGHIDFMDLNSNPGGGLSAAGSNYSRQA